MFSDTIPHTREGALIAPLIAAILRFTPWLRFEGVLALGEGHLYALCVDERHQIVVGFDSFSCWHAYLHTVGTTPPESEVAQ